jgi:hypothetical protein
VDGRDLAAESLHAEGGHCVADVAWGGLIIGILLNINSPVASFTYPEVTFQVVSHCLMKFVLEMEAHTWLAMART